MYFLTLRQGGGNWKETILHPFESATDGSEPAAGVFVDNSGNVYGTTSWGGSRYGYGTVYEITPQTRVRFVLSSFRHFERSDQEGPALATRSQK